MSVSLKCDTCNRTSDLALPMRFLMADDETAIEISVIRGPKSLDLCRSCLALVLADIAGDIAPRDDSIADRFAVLACQHALDGITYERRGYPAS